MPGLRHPPKPAADTKASNRRYSIISALAVLVTIVAVAAALGDIADPTVTAPTPPPPSTETPTTSVPPSDPVTEADPVLVDLTDAEVTASAERSSVVLRCHRQQGLDIVTLYTAEMLIDGDMNTGWGAGEDDGTGQSIRIDFGRPVDLAAVGLTPGFAKIGPRSTHDCQAVDAFPFNAFVPLVQYRFDDGSVIKQFFEQRKDLQTMDIVEELGAPVHTQTVEITILETVFPEGYTQDTILSEAAFWEQP